MYVCTNVISLLWFFFLFACFWPYALLFATHLARHLLCVAQSQRAAAVSYISASKERYIHIHKCIHIDVGVEHLGPYNMPNTSPLLINLFDEISHGTCSHFQTFRLALFSDLICCFLLLFIYFVLFILFDFCIVFVFVFFSISGFA